MPIACTADVDSAPAAALRARVGALVGLYQMIASTRMEGIPMLNHALHVEAVGFEVLPVPHDAANRNDAPALAAAVGVLITPWFMNLVWMPLARLEQSRRVGCKSSRHVGTETFEFIVAHEDGFGSYEACSLFSPVFEFSDHATAVATAQAVLDALRQPARAVAATVAAPVNVVPDIPARRAFLFGRSPAKVDRV